MLCGAPIIVLSAFEAVGTYHLVPPGNYPPPMAEAQDAGRTWLDEPPCTICRNTVNRPAYVVDGSQIVRCACCSHLYVSPRPSMDDVVAIYGEDYFENPAFTTTDHEAYFGYMDYLRDRENIQRRLAQVLQRIERHEWRGRLLDIGCGLGLFVEVAQLGGWDAWGVDLNEHAVKWGQEHVSERVRVGSAADIGAEAGAFDCVTMFDVIEHLGDPRADLAEVWESLRPGGLLVLVTPDAGALVSRALGSNWLEMKRAPEHLHFFTLRGLSQMLDLAGFTGFEWHSIGKITTMRTVMADLRFYSTTLFGRAERVLDRLGVADRVVDIDPRTKFCLYARKTHAPMALEAPGPLRTPELHRVRKRGLGRIGIRGVVNSSEQADNGFGAQQRKYWERKQRFLDPRSPGPLAFAVPKLDWAAEHLELEPETSVLDVGAGNGTLTWHLAQRAGRTVGIDFSRNLLERAPTELPFVQGDALSLPFADNSFDVVVESNFLHHVDDPVAVLREMKRVARARIMLIEPNRWHLPMSAFMTLVPSEHRGLRFDRTYVAHLAASAGLSLVTSTVQGAIYPNMTPPRLLPFLARFDKPSRFGAYVVNVLDVA